MARVLVIEPDRMLARAYATALRAAGHHVITCLSGQAGIQAADRQTPDLVVLELQLKGHNGVEFLYEFRSYPEWQRVPVIVQTLVPEQALQGIQTVPLLNIAQYVYKPTSNLEDLVDVVRDTVLHAVAI